MSVDFPFPSPQLAPTDTRATTDGSSREMSWLSAQTAWFRSASHERLLHQDKWDDCYRFAMPDRRGFYQYAPGEQRDLDVFDDTAKLAVEEFASRNQQGIIPIPGYFFRLRAGAAIEPSARKLVDDALYPITEFLHEELAFNSNLASEVYENQRDLSLGNCGLQSYWDPSRMRTEWRAMPLTEVLMYSRTRGHLDPVFAVQRLSREQVMNTWPEARYTDDFINAAQPSANLDQVQIVESVTRDASAPHACTWTLFSPQGALMDYQRYEGRGAEPFFCARWATSAGEMYGRGPLLNVLGTVRQLNYLAGIENEAAEWSLGGLYKQEDDGTVNWEITRLEPRTVVPYAPGTRGLEAVMNASDFRVGQVKLEDFRSIVRQGLYTDPMNRSPDATPLSSAEARMRWMDYAERLGPARARVMIELVVRIVERAIWLYRQVGLLEMPEVDGRHIVIEPNGPLIRAFFERQAQVLIETGRDYDSIYGQGAWASVTDPMRTAEELFRYRHINTSIMATPQEIEARMRMAAAAGGEVEPSRAPPSQAAAA